jgi:hypothetical protein
LNKAQAAVVTTNFIARVVYRMLMYKVEYEPLSVTEYEKRYRDQQLKYLEQTCTEPVEASSLPSCFLGRFVGWRFVAPDSLRKNLYPSG